MNPPILLLLLRIALALVLYAFLAFILVYLWRDVRQASRSAERIPPAHLVQQDRPSPMLTYTLSEVNLVGRSPDNTIPLLDETVSAYHARLSYQGGQWWLEDLGSRNGTAVNDLIVEDPIVVTYGDSLSFGRINLLLMDSLPQAPDINE